MLIEPQTKEARTCDGAKRTWCLKGEKIAVLGNEAVVLAWWGARGKSLEGILARRGRGAVGRVAAAGSRRGF